MIVRKRKYTCIQLNSKFSWLGSERLGQDRRIYKGDHPRPSLLDNSLACTSICRTHRSNKILVRTSPSTCTCKYRLLDPNIGSVGKSKKFCTHICKSASSKPGSLGRCLSVGIHSRIFWSWIRKVVGIRPSVCIYTCIEWDPSRMDKCKRFRWLCKDLGRLGRLLDRGRWLDWQ